MSPDDKEKVSLLSAMMLTDAGEPQPPRAPSVPLAAKLFDWLRHPLLLLLVSSAVIPALVYFLSKQRDLIESRKHQALDIVSKNSVFEGQLYGLYSELGLFHQSNQQKKPTSEDLEVLKRDLDKSWTTHYLEFRKSYPDAHVWVDDLLGQGVVLKLFNARDIKTLLTTADKEKLPPSDLKALANDIEAYKGNLSESLEELRKFRNGCISPEYEFAKAGPTSMLQLAVTNRLNELRDQRTKIITDMADIFSR